MTLKDRVALITGGAVRIGRALALALAQRQVQVAIHYHHSQREAEETLREIRSLGAGGIALQADLRQSTQVEKLMAGLVEHWGRIDILVNNAAVFYRTPFSGLTEKQWDEFLAVNLKAPFLLCRAAGEIMLRQGGGKIINIADVAAFRPWADFIPYCVSKAGLVTLTKALAKALAPQVTVNCIAPGCILPPEDYPPEESRRLLERTPLRRLGSPRDIVQAALFLLEGTDFITGAVIPVDGGQSI